MVHFGGGAGLPPMPLKPGQIVKVLIVVVVVVLLLWGGLSLFYTVGADSEAVVLRFGRYHYTAEPGLHFKLPFGIDQAHVVPVNYVNTMEFGFHTVTPGKRTVYATSSQDELATAEMLTGDLNIAHVEWTAQYRIKDAKAYLFNVQEVEGTIRDVGESIMRTLVGDRSVGEVITIGRTELAQEARTAMQQKLDQFGCGVELKKLNLQNVAPPAEVKDAFNAVNRARQKKEEVINQARAKRNSLVPAARGKAAMQIKEAEAYRDRKLLEVAGEMNGFLNQNESYRKAQHETRIRLYMETMEKIMGQAQRKVFLDESVRGILPYLDLGDQGGAK